MIYKSFYLSPIGKMIMTSDGENLIGLYFEGQKYFDSKLLDIAVENNNLEIFDITKKWLDTYFSGKNPDFTPKLKISGSDFRQIVESVLLKIPYGKTTTYGEIAKNVARILGKDKMSSQAVGGAVGHNQISIIVPCHRVVGSDGSLTGYAGGLNRKKFLLELEQKNKSVQK